MNRLGAMAVAVTCSLLAYSAAAEGNLAAKPNLLPKLVIDKNLDMSVKEYSVKTGQYYKWTIESAGGDEVMVVATDLFRNSWIDQIVIKDIEVHPMGGIYGIEFDEEGTADVFFVPIRPGNFEFGLKGHEARGSVGKFVVR